MSVENSALLLAWIAIAILTLAVAGLRRQIRIVASTGGQQRASVGPPVGTPIPDLVDHLAALRGPKLLLFVDATCSSCIAALELAESLAERHPQISFVAVFEGISNGFKHATMHVIANAGDAFSAFRIPVRPFAVLVDEAGLIVGAQPVGAKQAFRSFVGQASRVVARRS